MLSNATMMAPFLALLCLPHQDVMRNDEGRYLGAGQARHSLPNTVLECEIQALIIAMQNCWCRGYKRVILEGDNEKLYNILSKNVKDFATTNWI